nr:uncharacterized protein LOC106029182 isoform X2 [Cavia porcellus]
MLVFQILPYRGPDGMIHLDQGHLSFCLSWVLKYDSDLPPHSTLSLCFSNLGCKCSPVVLAETPGTSFCVGINHHPVNLPEPQYDAPSQQESGSREVMAATDGGLGPTRNPACSCPEMSPRLAMKDCPPWSALQLATSGTRQPGCGLPNGSIRQKPGRKKQKGVDSDPSSTKQWNLQERLLFRLGLLCWKGPGKFPEFPLQTSAHTQPPRAPQAQGQHQSLAR